MFEYGLYLQVGILSRNSSESLWKEVLKPIQHATLKSARQFYYNSGSVTLHAIKQGNAAIRIPKQGASDSFTAALFLHKWS